MSPLARTLSARIQVHGVRVSGAEEDRALAYLELLARWNRKINLTAFDLSSPTDEAIDRLVIEPFAASVLVRSTDRVGLDVGSGGGSPALPLAIRCPWLRMTLVESRQRKASFLREAIRVLEQSASVAGCRIEDVALVGVEAGSADVVSIRAVRLESGVARAIERFLRDSGNVISFGHTTDTESIEFRSAVDVPIGDVYLGSRRYLGTRR